jgi:hypothetical protein
MTYKNLHRISGIIVSVFVIAHLFNHAMAWFGIATHQRILETFRVIYRQPVVEICLILCFLFQAFSGVNLIFRLRKKEEKTIFEKVQIYSGVILGLFIIQHITATIGQRWYFKFDTNFYFASRVVLQNPIKWYFIPYYILGIMSFATHIANVHQSKMISMIGERQARVHFWIIISLFATVTTLILYVFMGGRFENVIPKDYLVY